MIEAAITPGMARTRVNSVYVPGVESERVGVPDGIRCGVRRSGIPVVVPGAAQVLRELQPADQQLHFDERRDGAVGFDDSADGDGDEHDDSEQPVHGERGAVEDAGGGREHAGTGPGADVQCELGEYDANGLLLQLRPVGSVWGADIGGELRDQRADDYDHDETAGAADHGGWGGIYVAVHVCVDDGVARGDSAVVDYRSEE